LSRGKPVVTLVSQPKRAAISHQTQSQTCPNVLIPLPGFQLPGDSPGGVVALRMINCDGCGDLLLFAATLFGYYQKNVPVGGRKLTVPLTAPALGLASRMPIV
jgi:hypothetical protein